jgi:dGTPase
MAVSAAPRATYASDPARSRGRVFPEQPSRTRSEFQRDRDRIIHCVAFRRLAHKTQVFVNHEGDHFRTRLTHTIEVSQIARAIARSLGLDEDLAETLALAHDLGHACFGHAGEDALDLCMRPWGGFDHNAQALRIVTRLERRYARYDGLNLTWESVEGLVKHNGPLLDASGRPSSKYPDGLPQSILDVDAEWPLDLAAWSSAEAQTAALADDIAYDAHDIDDGLRAGVLEFEALTQVPLLAELIAEIDELHPNLDPHRRAYELTRRVITRFVEDATDESVRRLALPAICDSQSVRRAEGPVVAFSDRFAQADRDIKAFLTRRLYRQGNVQRARERAEEAVRALFMRLFEHLEDMPEAWSGEQRSPLAADEAARARVVCDYIAGMTDRFAMREHARLFGARPELA